ncbi:N-acetylneuraminate 9-O-acetyltransferase isoform X1 [Stegostoma tigrinum]|uniref:N-acetylneuraminate 9-O-acetyltransferase isoform X1 n=3 Tax=Stegostoma tigrinum TaxID=3053191 RepID=UPI00202B8C7A|nr:N-acetylneuraminate 9-O-acetyltransferase isoform X1 [Stegostoma tigrinum]
MDQKSSNLPTETTSLPDRGGLRDRFSFSCHGGAKMAAQAYAMGSREINQHFNIRNAKLLAISFVLVLTVGHGIHRSYGGGDTCEWLLSSGRFLGENVWQPNGCMMHKYKISEVKNCLLNKYIAFVGDSRIRQFFYAFVKIINSDIKEEGNKHENISFEDRSTSLKVDFLWYPEVNNSMKDCFKAWTEGARLKPHLIVVGAATWSIKIHNGSMEALSQYKTNLTLLTPLLQKLAETNDIYWVLQDPVYEDLLSENRKMITNQRIGLYNDVTLSILNSSARSTAAKVKILRASKLIAEETIAGSLDGLHLPETTRDINAMILLNSYCNRIVKPIDGSCCLPQSPLSLIQKLTGCFFIICMISCIVVTYFCHNWRKNKPSTDVESGEEKKPATTSLSNPEKLLLSLSKLGLIMGYFYLCDRADLFMKEQKYYTHSTFFIPLVYIIVLGVFYYDNTKETTMLNREQTDEWKGWMQLIILIYHISGASTFLPVYMHVRVLVAAYLFQTGYGHFSFFWKSGEYGISRICQILFRLNFLVVVLCLVMDRPYQFYYFVPLVTFWFMVIYVTLGIWPQTGKKEENGSCSPHWAVVFKLVGLFLCICLLATSQRSFENAFSVWPISKLFEWQGFLHEWWFRWKLDRFAVLHGMVFAFLYSILKKSHLLSEGKGETLFAPRLSSFLLFTSVVVFLTYSIWCANCKSKTECNELHPYFSVLQILSFILIRNIPGYVRSVYSSFFAWFGKISLELFICQYHIWLAADTKGILVLIPGNPVLNIIVSTFIFVLVAHEISQITNDLVQIAIPKDNYVALKRLCATVFLLGLLTLSTVERLNE